MPSAWGASAPATYTYRADGLAAARKWNGESDANALTFAYDPAKRPAGAAKGSFLTLGQAYDRRGNVTQESRTLAGVSGIAGSGSQSFSYDALSRLTGSSGLAGVARTYGYDLDSNRVAFTLGSDAYAVTFDRTDEAIAISKNGGAAVAFLYDRYGNVLSDAAAGTTAGVVTYGYDLADRTTSITRAGTTTSLALDAAGRPRTRTSGSSVDTLTYLAASNEVVRVANAGGSGTTTDALLDAAGTRLGTRSGSTVAWLTPDLHGSIAAGLPLAASSVTDALRYDGYGVTLAAWPTGGSEASRHWKYQGRLDLAPGAPDAGIPSLYDFGFREYAPALGAFTSLDDLMGSAQDPASLNRFLYAAANPATLVDPDGHKSVYEGGGCGPDGRLCGGLGGDHAATETATKVAGGADAHRTSSSRGAGSGAPATTGTAGSTPVKSQPAPGTGTGPAAAYDPTYTDADAIWDCFHGGIGSMYDCDNYRQLLAAKAEARSGDGGDPDAWADAVGIADPTGIVDFFHGVTYLFRGDLFNAIISGVSILPFGDFAKAGRYADDVVDAVVRGSGRTHMHHTVPREILKQLPEDVANSPLVLGRAGAPNRWAIPEDVHKAIHQGAGGGAYNVAWKDALAGLGHQPTVDDVLRLRTQITKQFGIDIYGPR